MQELIALLSKAPPGLIAALIDLIKAILNDEDPQRACAAAASKYASQAALREMLP